MKKKSFYIIVFCLAILISFSCTVAYKSQSVQYASYRIQENQKTDSVLYRLIARYGEQVNRTMNDVIGIADISLEKNQPECTLGNFLADAFLTMAREKYSTHVDVAIMNYGGMRLTQLPAGNVTTGKIFELMPFDNLLILQKMKGSVLQQFLNLTAAKGGWPVAGLTMQISKKKAVLVLIGGQPLDPEAEYTIVNSDFIANGGDNADMLRPVPQITNGYLMRDAIFDYIKLLKSKGKNMNASLENRVRYAE